jgi:type IV secretion system protein VirB6
MGFFGTFWNWLNGQLTGFIGDNTARLATVLEPAVVTLATLYVMTWGYLQLAGKIEEPLMAGLKRIAMVALVLGVGLRLWLYNSVLVDTFYSAPTQLAGALVGAADPVGTIDAIWDNGGAVAGSLWNKGGVLSGDVGFYLAGAVVWLLLGVLCVYVMFLIALSSVALAVLLALGPLFVAMLLFDATRRLFAAWMAQLTNYALVTVLTVMMAALLLHLVQSYAQQTAARGAAILTVDALNMVLVAGLVFLVLRQIMPIAASIAGGVALVTFGLASRQVPRTLSLAARAGAPALGYALPHVAQGVRGIGRGASSAVSHLSSRASAGVEALARSWRGRKR